MNGLRKTFLIQPQHKHGFKALPAQGQRVRSRYAGGPIFPLRQLHVLQGGKQFIQKFAGPRARLHRAVTRKTV